jgi:N-acetylneuraminic acid mutarotase
MVQEKEPIVLTCQRCQNTWEYHGNNPYVATCSFCKTTVSERKHKMVLQAGPTLASQASSVDTAPQSTTGGAAESSNV